MNTNRHGPIVSNSKGNVVNFQSRWLVLDMLEISE